MFLLVLVIKLGSLQCEHHSNTTTSLTLFSIVCFLLLGFHIKTSSCTFCPLPAQLIFWCLMRQKMWTRRWGNSRKARINLLPHFLQLFWFGFLIRFSKKAIPLWCFRFWRSKSCIEFVISRLLRSLSLFPLVRPCCKSITTKKREKKNQTKPIYCYALDSQFQ